MDALMATYGSDSDESEDSPPVTSNNNHNQEPQQISNTKKPDLPLPPPPLDLLKPPNSIDFSATSQGVRIRSFPHVEGNYALHVFIPVFIPSTSRKLLANYVKRIASAVPDLYVVDVDIALNELCKDEQKLEQILLGREFHISLGRTLPIQVHQIDSIVAMLRQKFLSQRRYWIEFNKWAVFVNDDLTRSFISLEVTGGGLSEICRQIQIVDDIYRLHGLPEFYKDPRPHISLIWALGDISSILKQAVAELDRFCNGPSSSQKHVFMCKFSGIECKIGNDTVICTSVADVAFRISLSHIAPDWQSSNGHTICSGRKPRAGNRCPTCRNELGNKRCLAPEREWLRFLSSCPANMTDLAVSSYILTASAN